MTSPAKHTPDWYERRHELQMGQVFSLHDGDVVKLDRTVPGDGTQWYVADWCDGWSYLDSKIEPGELKERLSDDWPAKARGNHG